jgi:pyruvate kinase
MRTKIIATLGPASMDKDTIRAMAGYGVRIFRLNFSHAKADEFEPVVKLIREVEAQINQPLTVMGDLCGPKTRIGLVDDSPRQVNEGETVYLGLPDSRNKAEGLFIELDFPALLKGLEQGMPVSLSDGMLQFTVSGTVDPDRLYTLKAQNAGILSSNKGITFPGKHHELPAMTDKDREDVKGGVGLDIDAFALSFVQTARDMVDLKDELAAHGGRAAVVAKIERQNAVENIEAILAESDAVMVARGDLGLECPMFQVPILQKKILRAARHAQKGAIVATQMLLSMVRNPVPTRAEAADVAGAILDGADCVMLSEETAVGDYPVEAVRFIHQLSGEAEAYYLERIKGPYAPKPEKNPAKYLAYAATLLASNLESPAVVCHSTTGATARLLSSRRPAQPVYCLTPDPVVVRAMNFFWAVEPRLIDAEPEAHVERAERFIHESGDFDDGQALVITSGQATPGQPKPFTNEVKIYYK